MSLSVILWGNKTCYRRALPGLLKMCAQKQFRIIGKTGWVQRGRWRSPDIFPQISPYEISGEICDLILIFDWNAYEDIVSFLLEQPGVTREHILPGWLLIDRSFDLERYRFLQKSKVSILSNTCWGGILSRTLGIEHCSPTKNCWFLDIDYLKMLQSPEHYLLESDPVFDHWKNGEGKYDEIRYPVLRLDDIFVFCNHDTDPEAAIHTWLRRREKLDLENVFIEFSAYNRAFEKEFSLLERYPRKLCLVPWNTTNPCSIQFQSKLFEKDISAIIRTAYPWGFRAYFSPIELILSGEHNNSLHVGAALSWNCRVLMNSIKIIKRKLKKLMVSEKMMRGSGSKEKKW